MNKEAEYPERTKIEIMVAKLCDTGDTYWGNELLKIYDGLISELAKAEQIKEHLNSVSEEDAKEPIQDALYSTGKFTTDQCDVLVDGILTNLKEYGILILKKK